MLHQNLNEYFKKIASAGIQSLSDLKKILSSPDKIRSFSKSTGIPEDYLKLLKREAGSLESKPVPLSGLPNMDTASLKRLKDAGISTSRDYYNFYLSAPGEAAGKLNLPPEKAAELFSLSDLLRINGIGPVSAQIFFNAGFSSVSDIAGGEEANMLERFTAVNQSKNYYDATLGLRDMRYCIHFAKLLVRFSSK